MVDYRRMGNMKHILGNATLTSSLKQPINQWKSPRGAVLRIEALVVLAIIATFFHAVMGPCRCWSNSWIVQKGFLAAHAISLSLGPYIIGVMQSSTTRSEMYPIWAVSLYTLFGCVDPVTSYNGLDYKGSLSKMVYQICFHCGYVLLMGISTMTSDVGKAAIGMLSAITFVKGFHTSLALVQQKRISNQLFVVTDGCEGDVLTKSPRPQKDELRDEREVHIPMGINDHSLNEIIYMEDIYGVCKKKNVIPFCYDTCVAFYLSHKLHRRFLGMNMDGVNLLPIVKDIDFKWVWKLIEIELGFLYEEFFTGNSFLHYYQAKSASFWALASLVGICFVGVGAAIPGIRSSRHAAGPHTNVIVVDTTRVDVAVTLAILGSAALLQSMQLIRCWTSNWARVALACAVVKYQKGQDKDAATTAPRGADGCSTVERVTTEETLRLSCWMRFRESVATKTNWFDKYLWQDKLGQYSLFSEATRGGDNYWGLLQSNCARILGWDYIWEVLGDLLGSNTKLGAVVRLDDNVKESISHFLDEVYVQSDDTCHQKMEGAGMIDKTKLNRHWECFLARTTLKDVVVMEEALEYMVKEGCYAAQVTTWHILTCYCKHLEQEEADCQRKAAAAAGCFGKKMRAAGGGEAEENKNRLVAIALSNYCAYLLVSAPELLPSAGGQMASIYRTNLNESVKGFFRQEECPLANLAKRLLGDNTSDPWKVLADGWVRLLVYGAPYGKADAHMRHLAQGGEFITHLWALMYHLDIKLDLNDLVRCHLIPLSPHIIQSSIKIGMNIGLNIFEGLLSGDGFDLGAWSGVPGEADGVGRRRGGVGRHRRAARRAGRGGGGVGLPVREGKERESVLGAGRRWR